MNEGFVIVEEGLMFNGDYFHLYKGLRSGLYDISIEKATRKEKDV